MIATARSHARARRSLLTGRQLQIVEFIRESVRAHGYPPTIREICRRFGISSTNGVANHLAALERKGVLVRAAGAHRGIRLLEQPNEGVPLAGVVSAGRLLAAWGLDERIDFAELWAPESDNLALQVSEPIPERHIAAGDYLIVNRQRQRPRAVVRMFEAKKGA